MPKYTYKSVYDINNKTIGYVILKDGDINYVHKTHISPFQCDKYNIDIKNFYIVYPDKEYVERKVRELNKVDFITLEVGEKFILHDILDRTLVKINPVDLGYGSKTNAISHLSGNSHGYQHRCYCIPDDRKVERAE